MIFGCFLSKLGEITMSFNDIGSWVNSLLIWWPLKKLKDQSIRYLVVLLGLHIIKRGASWMVWVNSFPAQNSNCTH
jgi:hypothetical protein